MYRKLPPEGSVHLMLSLGKVEKPPEGRVHLMLSLGLGKVGKPSPTRAGTGQCSSAEALLDTHTFHFLMSSVRDAAARLPNGEGTRAEICELLKDSQFLAPDVTSTQVGCRRDYFCFVPEWI